MLIATAKFDMQHAAAEIYDFQGKYSAQVEVYYHNLMLQEKIE